MKVWIAAIYHCDGLSFLPNSETGAPYFKTEVDAKKAIYEYVYFYWIDQNEIEDDMPEDNNKAIEMWFSKKEETYLIHEFEMPVPNWYTSFRETWERLIK